MTSTAPPAIDTRYATKALFQELIDRIETLESGGSAVLTYEANLPYKLKTAVLSGAASTTNIALTGVATTGDRLLSVVQFDVAVDTGTSATGNKVQNVADLTSEATITAADTIQLSTTNTTGDKLLVVWYDASATAP